MGRFTDATVRCNDRTMEAHRAVLAKSSPVMRALFSQESFREGTARVVEITNAEPEQVEAMLRFMYIGEIVGDVDFVQLLRLADQYDVEGLPKVCCDALLEKLSVQSVVTTLC